MLTILHKEIELIHPLDNLNLMVKDETTELVVKLNYEEENKLLDLANFDNLTKFVIITPFTKY